MTMNHAAPADAAGGRTPKRRTRAKDIQTGPKTKTAGPKRKPSTQIRAITERANTAGYASVADACADLRVLIAEVQQLQDKNDQLKRDCTTWREAFMRATNDYSRTFLERRA